MTLGSIFKYMRNYQIEEGETEEAYTLLVKGLIKFRLKSELPLYYCNGYLAQSVDKDEVTTYFETSNLREPNLGRLKVYR